MTVLFEHPHRGDIWRLEVTSYQGRRFANWRKWYRDGDELKPTRQGATMPLDSLPAIEAAISDWRATEAD